MYCDKAGEPTTIPDTWGVTPPMNHAFSNADSVAHRPSAVKGLFDHPTGAHQTILHAPQEKPPPWVGGISGRPIPHKLQEQLSFIQ